MAQTDSVQATRPAAPAAPVRKAKPKPPARHMWLIMPTLGAYKPTGILASRYGNFGEVGVSVAYKTSRDWLFGVEGFYQFGGTVNEDVLRPLRTSEDELITPEGNFADIAVNQRGIRLPMLRVGKVWRPGFLGARAENGSGFVTSVGGGFWAHYLYINDYSRAVPQLQGDYRKGYDRMTTGAAISETVGFMYLDRARTWNFFIGFEMMQGFTKNRRYAYDLGSRDTNRRLDAAYGIRISWILPLYGKNESDEYWD